MRFYLLLFPCLLLVIDCDTTTKATTTTKKPTTTASTLKPCPDIFRNCTVISPLSCFVGKIAKNADDQAKLGPLPTLTACLEPFPIDQSCMTYDDTYHNAYVFGCSLDGHYLNGKEFGEFDWLENSWNGIGDGRPTLPHAFEWRFRGSVCRGPKGPCKYNKPTIAKCFAGQVYINGTEVAGKPLPKPKTCAKGQNCCSSVGFIGPKTNQIVAFKCEKNCPTDVLYGYKEYESTIIEKTASDAAIQSVCRSSNVKEAAMRRSLLLFLCMIYILKLIHCAKATTEKPTTSAPPLRCFVGWIAKNPAEQAKVGPLPTLKDCPGNLGCMTFENLRTKPLIGSLLTTVYVNDVKAYVFDCSDWRSDFGDKEYLENFRIPIMDFTATFCRGPNGPCKYNKPTIAKCFAGHAYLNGTEVSGKKLPAKKTCTKGQNCCSMSFYYGPRTNQTIIGSCESDCDPDVLYGYTPSRRYQNGKTLGELSTRHVCKEAVGECKYPPTWP